MFKRLLLLGLISLLLTACGSAPFRQTMSESIPPQGKNADVGGEAYAPEAEVSYEPSRSSSLTEGALEGRLVIKNASLSIVVEDPSASMDAISQMADEMGGFVVSSNLYQTRTDRGLEIPEANITIRVPAERLDQALQVIKSGAGDILSETVTGEDVTQEYTDLSSRLRNLENTEEQLTEIMKDANRTEEVLNVYNQLVEVREEIEVIKGQMQYYQQAAALSAISVSIQANEAVQPLQIGGWQPVGVAKRAIQALINTLEFFGDVLIWLLIYIVPVVLILYFPIRWIWKGLKRLFRRRKKDQIEEKQQE